MTEFELRNVEAAARAFFPRNSHPQLKTGAADLDVRGYFLGVVDRSSFRIAAALRLTILICAFGPIITKGAFATLASENLEQQQETLKLLMASPTYAIRQLVLLMKVHVAMVFGSDPTARLVMLPTPEAHRHQANDHSEPQLVSNLVKKGGDRGRSVA